MLIKANSTNYSGDMMLEKIQLNGGIGSGRKPKFSGSMFAAVKLMKEYQNLEKVHSVLNKIR